MTKIYGIGLSKTGTRSLTEALSILTRRRCYHGPDVGAIAARGSATDVPVAARYRALYELWPSSKFILTLRNEDEWLESLRRHCEANEIGEAPLAVRLEYLSLRWQLYGFGEKFDADAAIAGCRRHLNQVDEWFRDKPSQLLKIDICNGDGWDKICDFLGSPIPEQEFPWIGRSARRRT